MYAEAEELRVRLRIPEDSPGWDGDSAEQALREASSAVRAHVGARLDQFVDQPESHQFSEAKAVTLSFASRIYSNPEAALQKRLAADQSVSLADSSESATGLTRSEIDRLNRAFFPSGKVRRRRSIQLSSPFVGGHRRSGWR